MICNLVCKFKVRRWTLPIIAIANYIGWDWLVDKCIITEIKSVPVAQGRQINKFGRNGPAPQSFRKPDPTPAPPAKQ